MDQHQENRRLRAENQALRDQLAEMRRSIRALIAGGEALLGEPLEPVPDLDENAA